MDFEQLPMPSTSTNSRQEMRTLLQIQRPRTRGGCQAGPRPCPWVACEYHLLLEHGKRTSKVRLGASHKSPGLILNLPRARAGRRRHLPSSAAAELVRVWIDDAEEILWGMPDSCELDVADRGEASPRSVQQHTGRNASSVRAIFSQGRSRLQTSAQEHHRGH